LPAVHADATDTVREAFRAGGRGYAEDVSALARPWGFALGQIHVPVLLWHGDADTVIH
jgi:alpha-beta hydrolase superfamily lysophospholipase